jgi:hypothetical protein
LPNQFWNRYNGIPDQKKKRKNAQRTSNNEEKRQRKNGKYFHKTVYMINQISRSMLFYFFSSGKKEAKKYGWCACWARVKDYN